MYSNPTNENIESNNKHWRYSIWVIPVIISIVGLIVVGVMMFGFYMSKHLYKVNIPLSDASMEIRIDAIQAYLWFEELLGGDEDKSMAEILQLQERAEWYVKAMIEGGESSHLKLAPLKEIELQDDIQQLQFLLEEQRVLFNARLEQKDSSGPGSQIDSIHHSLIEKLVSHSDKLEMDLKHHMINEYHIFSNIWLGATAFCGFLFLITIYAYYRYDNYRKENYLKIFHLQRMLVQNEKMATLGNMILSISHEVNNPNNFISFNIPILKDYMIDLIPALDEHAKRNPDFTPGNMPYNEFREDLNKLLINIENGSRRISRIVSDLKEFSKRKDVTKLEWIDIKDVIESVMTISGTKIRNMFESFEVIKNENLPQLYCDASILELIIINLVNNAAEAANKNNSWIRLNTFIKKGRKNTFIVEVSDNGSGIDESHIDKIFDPFFSTKSSKEGTGMGLYLCRTLVDQINGHIEVESEAGKGSVFRIILNQNGLYNEQNST